MDELITFLRARESEREAMANRLIEEHGLDRPFSCITWSGGGRTFEQANAVLADETGEYVQRSFYRPKDVLADVKAKRAIIDLHPCAGEDIGEPFCFTCTTDQDCYSEDLAGKWPCLTLRLLALPFAAHPSFREEWKP